MGKYDKDMGREVESLGGYRPGTDRLSAHPELAKIRKGGPYRAVAVEITSVRICAIPARGLSRRPGPTKDLILRKG